MESSYKHQPLVLLGVWFPRMGMPLLGIDHINKAPKRTKYMVERSIKIHN